MHQRAATPHTIVANNGEGDAFVLSRVRNDTEEGVDPAERYRKDS
jgi:hypothetical protein